MKEAEQKKVPSNYLSVGGRACSAHYGWTGSPGYPSLTGARRRAAHALAVVLLQDPRALASGHRALPGDVAQEARLTTRLGELAILTMATLTMARLTVAIPNYGCTRSCLCYIRLQPPSRTVAASITYGCSLHQIRLQASGIMPLTGMELDAVAWASLGFSLFVLLYKFISLSPTVQPLTALFAAPVSAPHTPLPSPLSLQGIKALDGIGAWFKAVYISYLMVMSSLLYIPITKMIVSVWICDTKQCATGEWYPLPSPTFNLREMFSADRSDDTHPA
eukprot:scaffold14600_cov37-Phaeocystis_antarctica.AAC.1